MRHFLRFLKQGVAGLLTAFVLSGCAGTKAPSPEDAHADDAPVRIMTLAEILAAQQRAARDAEKARIAAEIEKKKQDELAAKKAEEVEKARDVLWAKKKEEIKKRRKENRAKQKGSCYSGGTRLVEKYDDEENVILNEKGEPLYEGTVSCNTKSTPSFLVYRVFCDPQTAASVLTMWSRPEEDSCYGIGATLGAARDQMAFARASREIDRRRAAKGEEPAFGSFAVTNPRPDLIMKDQEAASREGISLTIPLSQFIIK